MTRILDLFLSGQGQIVAIAGVLFLWLALSVLGAGLTGRGRVTEGAFIYGWAAVSTVFTVAGVLFQAPFSVLTWILGACAVGAAGRLAWRRDRLFVAGGWRVLILVLPLILVASAMVPSQWDEFSHWLPAPQFLLLTDAFPARDNPVTGTTMLAAYPYGWPFLSYLVGRISGQFVDNAGGIFNVLLLVTFGMIAVRLALRGAGRELRGSMSWGIAALAVLAGTAFNPTFIQKIVLTAYSDISTAVATGLGAYLGWRIVENLAAAGRPNTWPVTWQFSLVMMLLINLRQPNLVLVLIIIVATALVAVRDPKIRLSDFAKLLPLMALPALAVYGLWRYHVGTEMVGWPGAEADLGRFADWNIREIPRILLQMLFIAGKKIGFFGVMFVAVIFGIRAFIKPRSEFDRLAIICGAAFLGYTSFLLFTYVAHFSAVDGLRAVSYWRYNVHAGMLSVIFGAYGLGLLWRRYVAAERRTAVLGGLAVILVLAAPVIFIDKLRFDLEPPKPHVTRVAKDIKELVPADAKLFIMDPQGNGESGVITRYQLGRVEVPWMSAFSNPTLDNMRAFVGRLGPKDLLLVHSQKRGLDDVVGLKMPPRQSHLLGQTAQGWRILRSWPYPKNHTP